MSEVCWGTGDMGRDINEITTLPKRRIRRKNLAISLKGNV